MTTQNVTVAAVRGLLSHIVGGLSKEAALLTQVDAVVVTGGRLTMLDLDTTGAPIEAPDGPLDVRATVLAADETTTGELIVWIRDGRLSALEYAWWTDDPPTVLPDVERVMLRR